MCVYASVAISILKSFFELATTFDFHIYINPFINNPYDTFFTMSSLAENPNPLQNIDLPVFFPDFSSSFPDDNDTQLFFDELTQTDASMVSYTIITNTITDTSNKPTVLGVNVPDQKRSKRKTSQQRKAGKKDRHSKIYTAQGLRDRRMRLSVQIARKFFDLQAMLGFDRASNTIEWLFTKSKKAIKEVTLKHSQMKNKFRYRDEGITSACDAEYMMKNVYGDTEKCQRIVYDPVAREMRDRARARARERTREKMMIKLKLWQEPSMDLLRSSNPSNFDAVGFYSSPFEAFEDSSSYSQEKSSPYEASLDYISTQLGSASSFPNMFGCQNVGGFDPNNCFLGFLESWETDQSVRISTDDNCGLVTDSASLTGNFDEQNLSSLFTINSSTHRPDEHENKS